MQGAMQQLVSQSFVLDAAALEAEGSLFKYYYTALPLHRKMQEFFNSNEKWKEFFESQAFYEDNDQVKGKICLRLMQYEASIGCYEQAIEQHKAVYGEQAHPSLASSLGNVGVVYQALGNEKLGLAYCKQACEMYKELYGDQPHSELASSLMKVGDA